MPGTAATADVVYALPANGQWTERYATLCLTPGEGFWAGVVIDSVRRGPRSTRTESKAYLLQPDADARSWLFLPSHKPGGEVYAACAPANKCTCDSGHFRKGGVCVHLHLARLLGEPPRE